MMRGGGGSTGAGAGSSAGGGAVNPTTVALATFVASVVVGATGAGSVTGVGVGAGSVGGAGVATAAIAGVSCFKYCAATNAYAPAGGSISVQSPFVVRTFTAAPFSSRPMTL